MTVGRCCTQNVSFQRNALAQSVPRKRVIEYLRIALFLSLFLLPFSLNRNHPSRFFYFDQRCERTRCRTCPASRQLEQATRWGRNCKRSQKHPTHIVKMT